MALTVLLERSPASDEAPRALRGAGVQVERVESEGGDTVLRVRDGSVEGAMLLLGRPLADSRLGEAALHSTWAEAGDAVDRHVACVRVSLPGSEASPLAGMMALSRWIAPLLELPAALALYGEGGGTLIPAAEARRRLASVASPPPLELWVGVRTFEVADAQGVFLDTLGMAQLGLPDLEAYAAGGEGTAQMAAWMRNVGLYLVQEEAEARLRDGDTLDGPDEQPWITHEDVATVEPSRPVLRFVPVPAAPG